MSDVLGDDIIVEYQRYADVDDATIKQAAACFASARLGHRRPDTDLTG